MKKLFCILVCMCVLMALCVTTSAETTLPEIKLTVGSTTAYVDGVAITFDSPPFIRNNEMMLPVRAIGNAIGISNNSIFWNDTTRTATLIKGETMVELTIDSYTAKINGEEVALDVPACIYNNRAYLPARFVAEAFGNVVWYDDATQTMFINPANIITGECGDNATFTLDTVAKTLTINGSGAIRDYYPPHEDDTPWFDYRRDINTVIIENRITSIGDWAFHGCENLINIEIPDSVTIIGDDVFVECINLANIKLSSNLTYLGSSVFGVCISLTNIEIPDSITKISSDTFGSCINLASITIPKSVTSIGEYAFDDCDNLTIICYKGSYAETYANTYNFPVEYIIHHADLDGDGVVNVKDALISLKSVLNGTTLDGADMNGDGKVTLLDVLRVLKAITA